ncbi:MAG TPA: ParA family protein [Reyranella sp.]|nr:ParA family protein [Reyranella sp.]
MRHVAIANQKGGAAKTTTTVNLAAALAERKRKVLVVDLDPQGNSTDWLGVVGATQGVFEVLTGQATLAEVAVASSTAGIAVVPATKSLQGIERALAAEVGSELSLQRALRAPDLAGWDYVLIDTPPTLGILTLNGLAAARELIVPVETHVLALQGVAQLVETFIAVRERLNPGLSIAGVVACRVDSRTRHSGDVVERLRDTFKGTMYRTEVRENIRLAEAPSFRQSILDYDAHCSGAADYRALAAEVVRQEA